MKQSDIEITYVYALRIICLLSIRAAMANFYIAES
jgi:hypothetical protein